MAIAVKTRLGHYEIVEAIGAGGMGEVYRAHDPRLGRDVAVKIIPASFASDTNRLRRFEQEARAAAALNHPNILAVYDIGTHEDCPYIVSELLEGQSLRDRLRDGRLPIRKLTDYALQIARGLAAAHDRGIVHRDLKPDNIFITKDGRIKILDFGLAKLTRPETSIEDQTIESDPGTVLGTVGYMSPEQVRGKEADARSDLFSFGAVLYEMISGKRAFKGDSPVDTLSAILKEEPPELTRTNLHVPPALDRIVRHCLEKNPEERFRSAHDIAFDLELISSATTSVQPVRPVRIRVLPLAVVVVALILVAATAAAYWVGSRGRPPMDRFQRLTFRRGAIAGARFAPDGTIVYSAAWQGKPYELFAVRPGVPESRAMGVNADVLSISASGELAVILNPVADSWRTVGTLARVPMMGGSPRELAENVSFADWRPHTDELAVVRGPALEYPVGKIIHTSKLDNGWVGDVRFSPDGMRIAVLDHKHSGDDGDAVILDLSGRELARAVGFNTVAGLAWSRDGEEVHFAATRIGQARSVWALNLSGNVREVLRTAGNLRMFDFGADGRLLVSQEQATEAIKGLVPGSSKELDLEWLDWSFPTDISNDGKYIILTESGEGLGGKAFVYLRKTDGSPAVRIAEAAEGFLSPDRKWVLTREVDGSKLTLAPVGVGQTRQLTHDDLFYWRQSMWLPDSQHILFTASNRDKENERAFVMDVNSGERKPLTPEGMRALVLSPDGNRFIARDRKHQRHLFSIQGQRVGPVKGDKEEFRYVAWTNLSPAVVVALDGLPTKLLLFEPTTGETRAWKQLMPDDSAGVTSISRIQVTKDGKSYAYCYDRVQSDLYVVTGAK
jgi:Tol biopolymer transport system component